MKYIEPLIATIGVVLIIAIPVVILVIPLYLAFIHPLFLLIYAAYWLGWLYIYFYKELNN